MFNLRTCLALPNIEYKIETTSLAIANVRNAHEQFAPEQAVPAIGRLVGEIELGCEERAPWRLNFNVIVPRTPRVNCRHDSTEAKSAIDSCSHVTAITKPG